MILVTQGHEKSIGLEVFLKSFLLISKESQKDFILYANRKSLEENLNLCFKNFKIFDDHIIYCDTRLNCFFTNSGFGHYTDSTVTLLSALKNIKENDVLLTLPTSKDQLFLKGIQTAGYTEFLRLVFSNNDLAMNFVSPTENIVLVTDHIALENVPKEIQRQTIHNKILYSLNGHEKYFKGIDKVLVTGLNPHAGENELLGKQERVITQAIENIKKIFSKKEILGPLPGDTLSLRGEELRDCLQVYMYHDQGLSYFKGRNSFFAANLTFGLPFLRMSVDHGTAFELYGKNKANPLGCLYVMNLAVKANQQVHQDENRSHQRL